MQNNFNNINKLFTVIMYKEMCKACKQRNYLIKLIKTGTELHEHPGN